MEISIALINGINVLSVVLREISLLLSPVLDTASQMQERRGIIGLTDVDTPYVGGWNSYLYVNGRIGVLHTEKDCTYTFITVQNPIKNSNTTLQNKPMFLYKVNSKQQTMLPLMNDLSFAYNGNLWHIVRLTNQWIMMIHTIFSIFPLMVMVNCSTINVNISETE